MAPAEIRTALKAKPFRPFTLRTADGDTFHVSHPESMLMTPNGRTLVLVTPKSDLEIIDTIMLVSVNVNGRRTRRGRSH